jgi:hypothetical protein
LLENAGIPENNKDKKEEINYNIGHRHAGHM